MSRKRMLLLSSLLVLGMAVVGCSTGVTDETAFSHPKSEVLQESIGESSIEINYEALEVDYTGEAPIYDVCNYRDKIYFTCELEGEYAGIYEMAVGEDSSRAVLTGLTNGLIPKVITTGTDGSLYTILKSDDLDGKLQQMLLWKLDNQGNIVLEKDITELVPEKSAPWAIAVDAAGYIFVRIGIMREELFLVFDEVGNYSGAIQNTGNYQHIDALGRAQDGYVYAILGRQDATNILAKCDGATCSTEEYTLGPVASGSGLFAVVGAGLDSDLTLYGPGYGLCKYDIEKEATVYLASNDFPCVVDGKKGCVLEDGRFLMVAPTMEVIEDTIVYKAEGTKLYYIPLMAPTQKTQLSMAVFKEDMVLSEYIKEYNSKQTDCEIILKNYLVQGDEYIPLKDAVNNMMMEIATGKGPDLVNWGSWYSPAYVMNEAFVDLSGYVAELSEDNYIKNVLEAFAIDGKLYALVPEFKISTIVLRDEELNDLSEWRVEALMEYYENREAGTILFPGETSLSVFGYLCSGSIEEFIDWSNGTCNFEQESFKQLLEFANMFPKSLRFDDGTSLITLFREGKALLYPMTVSSVFDVTRVGTMFGERKVAYMGYPIKGCSGNVAEVGNYAFSINVLSKHQEEVMNFLETTMKESFQEQLENLPVSRRVLQTYIGQAKEMEYTVNAEGIKEPKAKTWLRFEGEEPVAIYNISQEDEESFWNLVESVEKSSIVDSTVYSIILEEMEDYFGGAKEKDDVINVIQSKAGVYLAEQMN